MSKAGLFAGEVTQAAPVKGAATTKPKGYWWMEWGNVEPEFEAQSFTDGYAITQDGFAGGTSYANPWADIDTPEWTMMAVVRPEVEPAGGDNKTVFELTRFSDSPKFRWVKRPITDELYFFCQLAQWTAGGSSNLIMQPTVELTIDHPTWTPQHWYCLMVSHKVGGASRFAVTNLTLADDAVVVPAIINDVNVRFPTAAAAPGTAQSMVGYGCGADNVGAPRWKWAGQMSQQFVHNKFLDLSVANNRRKLCGIDGVLDLNGGFDVFNETPLYFTESLPENNLGTLQVVNSPADFWLKGASTISFEKPPVAS